VGVHLKNTIALGQGPARLSELGSCGPTLNKVTTARNRSNAFESNQPYGEVCGPLSRSLGGPVVVQSCRAVAQDSVQLLHVIGPKNLLAGVQ
jgi:hypothetical protein